MAYEFTVPKVPELTSLLEKASDDSLPYRDRLEAHREATLFLARHAATLVNRKTTRLNLDDLVDLVDSLDRVKISKVDRYCNETISDIWSEANRYDNPYSYVERYEDLLVPLEAVRVVVYYLTSLEECQKYLDREAYDEEMCSRYISMQLDHHYSNQWRRGYKPLSRMERLTKWCLT